MIYNCRAWSYLFRKFKIPVTLLWLITPRESLQPVAVETVQMEKHCSLCVKLLRPPPAQPRPCQSLDAPLWHAQVCPLTYPEPNPSLERRSSSCSVAMDQDYGPDQSSSAGSIHCVSIVKAGPSISLLSVSKRIFQVGFWKEATDDAITGR